MRVVAIILLLGITGALVYVLNTRLGSTPAMGPLISPFEGFWQNCEAEAIQFPPNVSIPGLQAPAEVWYDERRVPHVFAQNDHDLYFLQGYVTARDRLFQMEMSTYQAAGRLSEVVGVKALSTDRLFRRLGLAYGAENSMRLAQTDNKTMQVLDAYTEGVNAWIASLSDAEIPVEYKMLGFRPEPWTAMKCILLSKLMAHTLTGKTDDLGHSNVYNTFGPYIYNSLFPDFPDSLEPIIPSGTPYEFEPLRLDTPAAYTPVPVVGKLTYPDVHPNNGSNNWAVSGKLTRSGFPLLCNDPHLELKLPSIWYEVQLSAPDHNVYGVSLPGTPSIIIGFNDDIAWGVTNASRDVLDWYHLELDPTGKKYKYNDEWVETFDRVEEIKVKDSLTVYDTVRYSRHGPIVYDDHFHPGGQAIHLAMRWSAHDGSNELMALYKLNRAHNHAEYRDAIRHFECPGQNFVFACKDGDIAITQQGNFPAKWPKQGHFILDGNNPLHEWQAQIPFEQNPHTKNPAQGFVYSANQIAADTAYPYYLDGEYEHFRNRRIAWLLSHHAPFDTASIRNVQLDVFQLAVTDILPVAMTMLHKDQLSENHRSVLALLDSTYQRAPLARGASEQPVISALWWQELYHILILDDLTGNKIYDLPGSYQVAQLIRSKPDFTLFDDRSTPGVDSLPDLVTRAFKSAADTFLVWKQKHPDESYTWSKLKSFNLPHLAGASLRGFEGRKQENAARWNVDELNVEGTPSCVNAIGKQHGPSWRMIVELGPEPQGWGVYPGGASGNPGSFYYDMMYDDWAAGRYFKLHRYKPGVKDASVKSVQSFTPRS